MNCANCKHWRLESNDTDGDPDYLRYHVEHPGSKLKRSDLSGHSLCVKIADPREAEPGSVPLALTVDAEDYYAGLLTAPNFGCVLYEEKET